MMVLGLEIKGLLPRFQKANPKWGGCFWEGGRGSRATRYAKIFIKFLYAYMTMARHFNDEAVVTALVPMEMDLEHAGKVLERQFH